MHTSHLIFSNQRKRLAATSLPFSVIGPPPFSARGRRGEGRLIKFHRLLLPSAKRPVCLPVRECERAEGVDSSLMLPRGTELGRGHAAPEEMEGRKEGRKERYEGSGGV